MLVCSFALITASDVSLPVAVAGDACKRCASDDPLVPSTTTRYAVGCGEKSDLSGTFKYFTAFATGGNVTIACENAKQQLIEDMREAGYFPFFIDHDCYSEKPDKPLECKFPTPPKPEEPGPPRGPKYPVVEKEYRWHAVIHCQTCKGIFVGRAHGNSRVQALRLARKQLGRLLRKADLKCCGPKRSIAWKTTPACNCHCR